GRGFVKQNREAAKSRGKNRKKPRPAAQKLNFSDNCRMRGSPSVLVILPKFELVREVFGSPRFVRLNVLKASNRNCVLKRSPSIARGNDRTIETSKFANPGPSSAFRPSVPTPFAPGF